jgi:hypothetical protein
MRYVFEMLWYKISVDIIVENVSVSQLYILFDRICQISVHYALSPFAYANSNLVNYSSPLVWLVLWGRPVPFPVVSVSSSYFYLKQLVTLSSTRPWTFVPEDWRCSPLLHKSVLRGFGWHASSLSALPVVNRECGCIFEPLPQTHCY